MEYLKIWVSFREHLEPLNESERGRLFMAMLEYAESETAPELKGNERFVWAAARQTIDRARAESNRLAANGSKGGRKATETNGNQTEPTGTNGKQTEPNSAYKEKDKVKEKENDKETLPNGSAKKAASRFTPPTVDEVREYCRSRNNNVAPERFVDFYASKGWKVGNQPMKDWRAAVRTWEKDDRTQKPQGQTKRVNAQQYTQREYTEDELASYSVDLLKEAREGA